MKLYRDALIQQQTAVRHQRAIVELELVGALKLAINTLMALGGPTPAERDAAVVQARAAIKLASE